MAKALEVVFGVDKAGHISPTQKQLASIGDTVIVKATEPFGGNIYVTRDGLNASGEPFGIANLPHLTLGHPYVIVKAGTGRIYTITSVTPPAVATIITQTGELHIGSVTDPT